MKKYLESNGKLEVLGKKRGSRIRFLFRKGKLRTKDWATKSEDEKGEEENGMVK